MEHGFWHNKWETKDISFHEPDYNALMVDHFSKLGLKQGARVFVPLCGKSHDMHWLLDQGYEIVGAELSSLAVEQFFEELNLKPVQEQQGELARYCAENIEIYAGDIFQLTQEQVGSIDGVYDRAALVALPEDMREEYGAHITEITNGAPQLLIVFEYDQSQLAGPPFSISSQEIVRCYKKMDKTELDRRPGIRKLKGAVEAEEIAWLLKRM